MTTTIRLTCLAALALLLAACANQPAGDPAAAAKPPAAAAAAGSADEPPMDQTEARAQCWMKYDKSGASLEAKAQMVGKCVADKMKGQ